MRREQAWEILSALLAPATGTPGDHPRPVPQHPRRTSAADADPPFWELALAHVFSYIAAMDMGLQRLSWSQQKLPDAQLPLASNAGAWLALRRAGRELTKSPGWLEEEARHWVQTMPGIMPKTVTYRRRGGRVEAADNELPLPSQ